MYNLLPVPQHVYGAIPFSSRVRCGTDARRQRAVPREWSRRRIELVSRHRTTAAQARSPDSHADSDPTASPKCSLAKPTSWRVPDRRVAELDSKVARPSYCRTRTRFSASINIRARPRWTAPDSRRLRTARDRLGVDCAGMLSNAQARSHRPRSVPRDARRRGYDAQPPFDTGGESPARLRGVAPGADGIRAKRQPLAGDDFSASSLPRRCYAVSSSVARLACRSTWRHLTTTPSSPVRRPVTRQRPRTSASIERVRLEAELGRRPSERAG